MEIKNKKGSGVLRYLHAGFSLLLALFFINAGIRKFIPNDRNDTINPKLVEAVSTNNYTQPEALKVVIRSMDQTGFLKMIGVCQVLAALLIIIPRTRLWGLLGLLPIIFNIFFLHVFMDNRMEENIETGILLGTTLLLISFYLNRLKNYQRKTVPVVLA